MELVTVSRSEKLWDRVLFHR